MTEISHARARNASIGGLIVQAAACVGVAALAIMCRTIAGIGLAYFIGGGLIVWLAALLICRQRELVALERRDLELLLREKRAVGAEGMFDDSGFRVAETRLAWMLRWLSPTMSLIFGAYLIGTGIYTWLIASKFAIGSKEWVPAVQLGLALTILPVVLFLTFLYSRFASGLARVPEWSVLRACGSYLLGNTIATLALILCLGVLVYAGEPMWEHTLAYALPIVMVILGCEALLNFVLDIYRPRTPGQESRAAFDSRLLGLLSEPGGLAHSLAEAINYQFGFQVSQSWFYKLLERTIAPLIATGALALWLLSTVVVVGANERAIIERFGEKVDAEHPLEQGVHFKLPWPFAVAHKVNTDEVRQIVIGFQIDEEGEAENPHEHEGVILWTDAKHGGREHFDFVMLPSRAGVATTRAAGAADVPVHILRMSLVVQYRVDAGRLSAYLTDMSDPEDFLRSTAWQELTRFNIGTSVDSLLRERRERVGEELARRIREKLDEHNAGIEVVHVGLQAVHPENTVAQAFQRVVVAEQEKVTAVRQAQVRENSLLSRVSGSRAKALALTEAIENRDRFDSMASRSEQVLREKGVGPDSELFRALDGMRGGIARRIEVEAALRRARAAFETVEREHRLGLGPTVDEAEAARRAAERAAEADRSAAEALEAALGGWKSEASRSLDGAAMTAMLDWATARAGLEYWSRALEAQFQGLEGEAARVLAEAQTERWRIENSAAEEYLRLENERQAYAAAPQLYMARRYLDVLASGLVGARKYFLAFDASDRGTKIRIEAQETSRTDFAEMETRKEP